MDILIADTQINKLVNNPNLLLFGTIFIINTVLLIKYLRIKKSIIIRFYKIVKLISYYIIIISCLLVIRNLINSPYEDSSKLLLSAFGFLVLLGNICFALTNHISDANQKLITIKAGKRFMIASILLVLCTLLSYISSHSHIIRTNKYITTFRDIIAFTTDLIIIVLGFSLSYLAFQGFTIIFNYLWETFEFDAGKPAGPDNNKNPN